MLQGTFETLALPELLGLLASARKTGALRLEAGPVSGIVHLRDGHCLAVETAEQLGQVQDGPALLTRLVDVCFAVTRQESGAFRFASDEPAPWRSDEPVELSDALVEVDRLLKQWREILRVIPSLDCRPRLLDGLEVDEIILDRDRWALLVGIDGRRSVRELVQRAARPVIEVCHSLLELVEAGAIQILDPPDAVPAPTTGAPVPAAARPAAAPPGPSAAPAPIPTAIVSAPAAPEQSVPAPPVAAAPVAPKLNDGTTEPQPPAPGESAPPTSVPSESPAPEAQPPKAQPPEAQPSEARQVAAGAGDDGPEAPDKGAFLRLFSGLRDG